MKTKLNVKLLRTIQAHILEEPKRFIMADVICFIDPGEAVEDDGLVWDAPKCGTTACIGGWALLLSKKKNSDDLDVAADLLGLGQLTDDTDDADRLFHVGSWPEQYRRTWFNAKTPRMRARVAVRRIDHFIKTKGAE